MNFHIIVVLHTDDYPVVLGMLVILYCVTLESLWRVLYRSKGKEARRTWFFIGYITILFILGTLYFIAETWGTEAAFVDYRNFPGGPLGWEGVSDAYPLIYMGNVVYILADWMADGLLVRYFDCEYFRKSLISASVMALLHYLAGKPFGSPPHYTNSHALSLQYW